MATAERDRGPTPPRHFASEKPSKWSTPTCSPTGHSKNLDRQGIVRARNSRRRARRKTSSPVPKRHRRRDHRASSNSGRQKIRHVTSESFGDASSSNELRKCATKSAHSLQQTATRSRHDSISWQGLPSISLKNT